MHHVPDTEREKVSNWLKKQGCKDEISTMDTLNKWLNENNQSKDKSKDKTIFTRGE